MSIDKKEEVINQDSTVFVKSHYIYTPRLHSVANSCRHDDKTYQRAAVGDDI